MTTMVRYRKKGRFDGKKERNTLEAGRRFVSGKPPEEILNWPDNGRHEHGEPTTPRKYEDVVDFFHNYEHSPEGLNHCHGSEANPYTITHVNFAGRIEHKISLSYARGHGRGNEEQWFRFREMLEDGYHLETGEKIPEPPREKWNVRESRYLSTRHARRVQGAITRTMTRAKAGQKQRIGSGHWEEQVNRQQRKLVRIFDQWSAALKREITSRSRRGATVPELQAYIDDQVPRLETRLVEIMNAGVTTAARTGAGNYIDNPAVQALIEQKKRENLALIHDNLVPKVHEKLTIGLASAVPALIIGGGLAVEQQKAVALAIKNATTASRSAPAQYAGGYWTMLFETQQTVGGAMEDERRAQGLAPEPVRWVLDPLAVHCKPSPGFYGCPELAKVYKEGWRSLPTVPAGQVTCRGNCRCHIEVKRDGQWRRGLFD